jgi:glyoxylase-like metal-dependent hydrolase (beta-lactamase superfamily II)
VRRSERRKLEVDDDDARLVPGHGGRQPTSIVRLCDDGMARLFQEALQAMADQMLVIREYESHYR